MPPILVTKPSLPPFEEYTSLIQKIWEKRWLTNSGPLHEQLRTDLAAYLNLTKENISLFTNGHQALEATLHALNLPKGSEVITTPYTFASTTHAIVRCGLKPVFCDIAYDDYNIDVTKIEELITENTSAILPVHVYGTPCDVDKIQEIADQHGLKVIYDAAHAFGVSQNGRSLCSFGDASMLSFHATKVFNTVEGGALISRHAEIPAATDRYKNFGMEGQEDFVEAGTNAKMSEFHAAMGICNLRHIEESIAARKKVCEAYDAALGGIAGLKILKRAEGVVSNYAYYPILVEDSFPLSRDELADVLREQEIFSRKYFYPIVTEFSCYKGKYPFIEESVAKYVSERILCLPLYDTMTDEDVERVLSAILGGKR